MYALAQAEYTKTNICLSGCARTSRDARDMHQHMLRRQFADANSCARTSRVAWTTGRGAPLLGREVPDTANDARSIERIAVS